MTSTAVSVSELNEQRPTATQKCVDLTYATATLWEPDKSVRYARTFDLHKIAMSFSHDRTNLYNRNAFGSKTTWLDFTCTCRAHGIAKDT